MGGTPLFPMVYVIVLAHDPHPSRKGAEGLASYGVGREEETTELWRFPAPDEISLLARSDRNKRQYFPRGVCTRRQAPPSATPMSIYTATGGCSEVFAQDGLKNFLFFLERLPFLVRFQSAHLYPVTDTSGVGDSDLSFPLHTHSSANTCNA